ncbi:type IV pilus assembly protein PilC [Azomonas agilis]|uniref:Type IV pilus assembly protein PilC n=1 Tax=Azomonas agilis TaxID=116849 RepID=A0A562IZ39_9GAMM|nr:type II secretion system F family protein [Azomonas agilis]TWH76321.1 type IV pilus assembly protein PilC [Azomonas agilis]
MQQMPPSLTKSKALKELKDKKKPTPPKKPTKAAQVFVWEGVDRKGVKVSGEMMGIDANLIKANLRRQGVNPQKIRKKSTPLFSKNRRIKPMDIALFTRQMATMLKAGVPLVQACDIIAGGFENPRMITLLGEIKQEVESGTSFANALRTKPEYFDDLYCSLVESGEQSGALETLMDRVATHKEKTEALKAKVKKAMTYPIAVVIVAVIVSAILLIKVVPQFESVFQGFGADLPAFTRMVISLSEWLQEWWLLLLPAIGLSVFLFQQAYRRSEGFHNSVDRALLKAPIVGDILHKSAIARYERTLATTFAAGVPLVEALDSVGGVAGNIVFRQAIDKIRTDVASGMQLNYAMRATNLFPAMAVQMTAIGEESGALDEMLDKAASFYEAEVDHKVDNLTTLMEPMIMSVLGVLVGGLIIAMYLPIFQLGGVVG